MKIPLPLIKIEFNRKTLGKSQLRKIQECWTIIQKTTEGMKTWRNVLIEKLVAINIFKPQKINVQKFWRSSCWKRLSSKILKNETVKALNIIGLLSILWSSLGEANTTIQFYWNNTIFGTNSNIVRSSI